MIPGQTSKETISVLYILKVKTNMPNSDYLDLLCLHIHLPGLVIIQILPGRPIHYLFLDINWIKSGQVKKFKKPTGKKIELYKSTKY